MAGRRPVIARSVARRVLAVLTASLVVACGGTPQPARDTSGGFDFGPLLGSWVATVRGDGIWQGRWELHVQGGAILLVQPDGELIVPGTVDAFGAGGLVFGPTLACDSNVGGVRRGVYTYELTSSGLRVEPSADDDGCLDRRTILSADTWRPAPRLVMPVRVDAQPDASCEPPPSAAPDAPTASGPTPTPATSLPLPWELVNQTAGVLIVVDPADDGSRTLVASAAPGETAVVDPQRGGTWEITDLPGRCLARVSRTSRVTVRTGAPPTVEARAATT